MRTFDARVESVLGHKGLPPSAPSPSHSETKVSAMKVSSVASPKSGRADVPTDVLSQMQKRTLDAKSSIAEAHHAASVLMGAEATRQRYMQYGRSGPKLSTSPVVHEVEEIRESKASFPVQKHENSTFIKCAGGLPLLIAMPVVVFVLAAVILFATSPAFVRKRPKTEYELAEVDNLRVALIAAGAALVTAAVSVIWAAVKMNKMKNAQ